MDDPSTLRLDVRLEMSLLQEAHSPGRTGVSDRPPGVPGV